MSGFDEWFADKTMWRDDKSIPKNLLHEAYKAGMERAAVIADKWELAEYAAEAIRKEIEK